jgi:hypothetical protein
MLQPDKLKKLATILQTLNEDTVSSKQLVELLAPIIGVVQKAVSDTKAVAQSSQDMATTAQKTLQDGLAEIKRQTEATDTKLSAQTQATLNKALAALAEIQSIKVKDGDPGEQGPPGPAGSADTPEQIWDKLNQLPEDYQLDAKRIKGLPEARSYHMFGGSTSRIVTVKDEGTVISKLLRSLNFVGAGVQATTDQNGNITVTVSGGAAANESNGETLTDSGNHTTFTFAHAPKAGGVRNVWQQQTGQLLSPTTDYTVSGSTLTATVAQMDGNGNSYTLISNYTY